MPKDKDVERKIINFLTTTGKPLKAFHISKGINESPQTTCYHIKRMVGVGLLLPISEDEGILYGLQAPFYASDAENALTVSLTPFVEAFASTLEANDISSDLVVYENLKHYLRVWMKNLKKDLDIGVASK